MHRFLLTTIAATMLAGAGVANASVYEKTASFSFVASTSPFTALFSWVDAVSTPTAVATKTGVSPVEGDGKFSWTLFTNSGKRVASANNLDDSVTGDVDGLLSGEFKQTFSSLQAGLGYTLVFAGKWAGIKDNNKWSATGPSVSVAAAPVPEPESYALMLAGLGLMGAIARRRSKSKAG